MALFFVDPQRQEAKTIPQTFIALQSVTRNVTINNDSTISPGIIDNVSNAIYDGTLLSTWGINGITTWGLPKTITHIRIGTNIMQLTFIGAYNFYGFFVDNFGNPVATSPYPSATALTSFVCGYLIDGQEYPVAALQSLNTNPLSTTLSGQLYGNGVYTVRSSPNTSPTAGCSLAFNKQISSTGNLWRTNGNTYASTGAYSTSLASGLGGTQTTAGVNGEWLDIQLPTPIILETYRLIGKDHGFNAAGLLPRDWSLFGTNDGGTTWTLIDAQTNQTSWASTNFDDVVVSLPENTTAYNRYRIVIQAVQSSGGSAFVLITEMYLFGLPTQAEYPPIALTGFSTTVSGQSYGNGTYVISSSGDGTTGGEAWRAFDKTNNSSTFGNGWYGLTSKYDVLGNYTGTQITNGISGEWLDIVLPQNIRLNSFSITNRGDSTNADEQAPWLFSLLASPNGGITWINLSVDIAQAWTTNNQSASFSIVPLGSFNKYRLVISKIGASASLGVAILGEVRLFGVQSALYDNLSRDALNSMRATYSLKLLFSNYRGAVVNIRRSNDNVTSDFFADFDGNLVNSAGTSLSTWLGAATAYVTTWYDQSGNGRHATQTTTNRQPRYNTSKRCLDFGSPQVDSFFSITAGTVPLASPYTFTWRHGVVATNGNANNSGPVLFGGQGGINSAGNSVSNYKNNNYLSWGFFNDWDTGVAVVDNTVATFKYDGFSSGTMTFYRNGSTQGTSARSGYVNRPGASDFIARDAWQGTFFNSELYHLAIFGSALSDSDRFIVEFQ